MKKNLTLSLVLTVVINTVLSLINVVCAFTAHVLPLSIEIIGGDCIEHIGFGVRMTEIFAVTPTPSVKTDYIIEFDLLSIVISVVVIFIISFILLLIINKIKNKGKKKNK